MPVEILISCAAKHAFCAKPPNRFAQFQDKNWNIMEVVLKRVIIDVNSVPLIRARFS